MTSIAQDFELDAESEAALAGLIDALQARHHNAVCGALLYGSCLRSGNIFEGLVDLYLLVDNYGEAYASKPLSLANWLLPPNVFHAEHNHNGRELQSKVTVISLADFRKGSSRAWFESYIWGRFAQPTHILYCRNDTTRTEIEDCLRQSVTTLLQRALPALPAEGDLLELWQAALALSYNTELRTERSGRSGELVASNSEFYIAVSADQTDSLSFPFAVYDAGQEWRYRCDISAGRRQTSRLAWRLRRLQGKLMSVLRLLKALFTFEGGLDYIAWKLERHSGQAIEIPERVRQYPLVFMWPFFWGLYRRGIFK